MKQLFFISLLLLFVVSCSKDDAPTNNGGNTTTEQIMPLAVGNMWIYSETFYDTLGTITLTRIDTVYKITGSIVINNETWFLTQGGNARWINRSDGLWVWVDWNAGDPPYLGAKYPANVGDTFISGDGLDDSNIVISTNSTVTVPHGQYSCYHYRASDLSNGELKYDAFFAVSKGIIKIQYYNTSQTIGTYLSKVDELTDLILN